MAKILSDIWKADGLPPVESAQMQELVSVFNSHLEKNKTKSRYYEGHIALADVNLGIALPTELAKLEIGCAWGEKTVDVLASRSMFDGFVSPSGMQSAKIAEIMQKNRMRSEYMKACRDELKYGCTFATLSADPEIGVRIRFHSPETSAALWDGEKQRIQCGFAIIDSKPSNEDKAWRPALVNFYTADAIWVMERVGQRWYAKCYPHTMGRPLMEPLIWNATSGKPFGRSRLKEPVRRLIEGYVRTVANATIGLEFATSPQKYLLGITDEQYDAVVNQKFRQYVGSILAATTNPDTGANPVFGQLQQGNIEPHVQMLRLLATQFSAATGLTISDTGVINDANPTSSDAILAQSQTLVLMAEQLNAGNGEALYNIAQMALAIADNVHIDELPDEDKQVMAHFKNPAMPSVSVTADAAIKIASARMGFSETDVFAEMVGFDQADIRRMKAQETKARGLRTLNEEIGNDLTGSVE